MIFNQKYLKGEPIARRFDNTDMYLFLGDSVMTGGVAEEPVDWPTEYAAADYSNTLILYKDDRTNEDFLGETFNTLRFLPYSTRVEKNRFPGYGVVGPVTPAPPYAVGIDNSFMYYMSQNAKKTVGLCKWALGGTTLIARSGANNDWGLTTDEMYRSGMDYYSRRAHTEMKLKNGNPPAGSKYKACVIILGTNDTDTAVWNQAAFIAAIPAFIQGVRDYVGQPAMPIYWMQIRQDLYLEPAGNHTLTNVNQGRAALANCVSGGSTPISGFNLLDYESVTTTVDGVHIDADSGKLIGLDLAQIFLAL